MNFYNPYIYSIPENTSTGLLSKINFSSIINGTTKTLNIINQAIPMFKQVSPIIQNAKTMFSVMNEFKKIEPVQNQNVTKNTYTKIEDEKHYQNNNYPTFFI